MHACLRMGDAAHAFHNEYAFPIRAYRQRRSYWRSHVHFRTRLCARVYLQCLLRGAHEGEPWKERYGSQTRDNPRGQGKKRKNAGKRIIKRAGAATVLEGQTVKRARVRNERETTEEVK
eukprot:6192125-Pleurochrysis_carterae.AAC.2